MENQKATESAGTSSGEIHERANSKTEKTHQKITLPIFKKRGIQEAKLWWRRFTQYIKMTQNIDLNIMTTDREILEGYRNDLEHGESGTPDQRSVYLGIGRISDNGDDKNR